MEREAYAELYRYEDRHWWFVARRMIIQGILQNYFPFRTENKILEIGCGTGGNLALLSNYGNVQAMDLDDEAIELANSREICLVKKGSLPNDIPFAEKFDLICMLDVLEHIDDDLGALKAVWNKLDPRGKLLLTVPAYKFLWTVHDDASHHKRRYLKNQLVRLVQTAGFKIIYSSYFDTFLFPIITVARLVNNIRGKACGTDISMPPKVLNSLLTSIFASERFLIPGIALPFGVSILLIAEK